MRRILLVLMCILFLFAPCAGAEGNLLVNGDFSSLENGMPTAWSQEAWLYDAGITYFSTATDGPDGANCVVVENVASNDARFVQSVTVEPETIYHLSGYVRAEGIPETAAGAGFSVMLSYATFPQVWDTAGEWVRLDSYFRTDIDQTQIVIGVRLGDYSADNTGKASFASVSLEKADSVPEGATLIQLTDYSQYDYVQEPLPSVEETDEQAGILRWGVLFLAVCFVLWLLKNKTVYSPKLLFGLLLVFAFVLRLIIAALCMGYETDNGCFYWWARWMYEAGPAGFYDTATFCDYPPGYLYLLWPAGLLLNAFGLSDTAEPLARIILRFVPILCDLGAVYLIWRLARKKLSETAALLLAALYALSPAVLIDSAAWGQVDAVLALGLLATVLLVQQGRWEAALPVFTVTVLMKPQALIVAPLGLLALVLHRSAWRRWLKGIGIALAVGVVMLLPFAWGRPITWIFTQYSTTLSSYSYATVNAPNLYYLLGANWAPLDSSFSLISYGTLGTVLTVASVATALFIYLRGGKERDLALAGAMCYILLYLFGTMMHERYLFPALALLLVAYVRRRDVRLLIAFVGYSFTLYCNCALVLRDLHLAVGFGLPGMALSVANLALGGLCLWTAFDKRTLPLGDFFKHGKPSESDQLDPFRQRSQCLPRVKRRHVLAITVLTLVYALIAFIGLGSTVAPQTLWTSTGAQETVVFDLGESRTFNVLYYGGISSRSFSLSFSDDGENWSDPAPAHLDTGLCFRWQYLTQPVLAADGGISSWNSTPLLESGRYVRLVADGPAVSVMEIVFRTEDGEVLPVVSATSEGARAENASDPYLLVDEPQTVCDEPSYYNGTYFDEIYHARTGYEFLHGLSTYEWTHPPLGKIFIMLGIKLFGMTPFGWRFSGALTGVLMIPAMYLLGLVLLKKPRWALLVAFLMAFDMMHLTQTRIATIDSYAVFFIILMYLCMFCYLRMNLLRDRYKVLIPLSLSGLFMGLGWATKWICFYSSVGLAVLFFYSVFLRVREWRYCMRQGGALAERAQDFPKLLAVTLLTCVGVFVIIPFFIYYFSYIPHFRWEGGLTWQRFWQTQVDMYNYHTGLVDDHAFQSPWYEWPLILKPMYFYDGKPFVKEGYVASIMCMGNPAVWWVGFAALLYVLWRFIQNARSHALSKDLAPGLILAGFAAQYLPWVLVPRSMFIYHYFGSLPFVMAATGYVFSRLYEHNAHKTRTLTIVYCAVTVALFIAFYPIATGVQFPRAWADLINWFSFLKLPGWVYRGWLYY
ncbi:MAG TPA: glycosyltransferase family 39 protein [Candidatus Aphodomonas merdavium]|nr:glycosyltransferase family 39 protein [Candidatus Aphodomonas merdavium]